MKIREHVIDALRRGQDGDGVEVRGHAHARELGRVAGGLVEDVALEVGRRGRHHLRREPRAPAARAVRDHPESYVHALPRGDAARQRLS